MTDSEKWQMMKQFIQYQMCICFKGQMKKFLAAYYVIDMAAQTMDSNEVKDFESLVEAMTSKIQGLIMETNKTDAGCIS